jgi:hypothetical protein
MRAFWAVVSPLAMQLRDLYIAGDARFADRG